MNYPELIKKQIEKSGKRGKGKKELIAHLEGKRLTLKQAIYANCYDCVGFYYDGRVDCETKDCPLHPFMPYNPNRLKKLTPWMSGKRLGKKVGEK